MQSVEGLIVENIIGQALGCSLEFAGWLCRNESSNRKERRYCRRVQMNIGIIREGNQPVPKVLQVFWIYDCWSAEEMKNFALSGVVNGGRRG